jgi:hypothetical protein
MAKSWLNARKVDATSRLHSQLRNWCKRLLHEKADRSQEGSFVLSLDKGFTPAEFSHCRHPSIRTQVSDLRSLGAIWAFSFQPVLPFVCRPVLLDLEKLA